MILAGDVGGTHTRLALFVPDERASIVAEHTFSSHEYNSLRDALREFLQANSSLQVQAACVGIAGPVVDGRCAVSNLPWVVTDADVAAESGVSQAWLINDLEAVAYGIETLAPDDLACLLPGAPKAVGNAGVLAVGTGLGVAGLSWDGARHHPFASEGGHASFAPVDAEQIRLLQWLNTRHPTVSWERVLSGPGLLNLYEFLRSTGIAEEAWLAAALAQGDAPALISQHAADSSSELCVLTLRLFASLLGAQAGNLALTFLATGGIYIAGGIAPKNLAALQGPEFAAAFLAKGRMRPLLEGVAVHAVLNQSVGLRGAYRCALRRLENS